MSKAQIETGEYIKRYAFWNPGTWTIPKLYWDAFSQEQRIHALCKQLAKIIGYADYLGENLDDAYAMIKDMQERYPELITEEVTKQLNVLLESGQLAEILENLLEEFREEARKIIGVSSEYNFSNIGRLPYRRSASAQMQGGVCTRNRYFYQYSNANDELEKFNIDSGLVINNTDTIPLGHCNSLTFIEAENKLLAYGTFGNDDLPYNRLTVIDGDTLLMLDEIELELPTDEAFVSGTNPIWEYGYMCAFDNENSKLYIAGQSYIKQTTDSYIICYDYSNGEFTLNSWGELPFPLATSASDMCAGNGYIYILTSEEPQIVVLDDYFDVVQSTPVNRIISDLTYASEFESISIVGEEFIVGYRASCFKNTYGGGSYVYAKASISASIFTASKSTPEFTQTVTLIVDNSNLAYDRDGTTTNPFNNIYEALNCAYRFSKVYIIDRSPNVEENLVIAVEPGQNVFVNAQNSQCTYGVRMDGGYLHTWWCKFGSGFNVDSDYFVMHLVDGAKCTMEGWYGYQQVATLALPDDSVYLFQDCELQFNGALQNINALDMDISSKVKQLNDAFVTTPNLIHTETNPNNNIKTKNLEGFHCSKTTDTLSNWWIPIKCSGMITCQVSGTTYYCPFTTNGQRITIVLPSDEYVGFYFTRNGQWGKTTMTKSSGVTITAFAIWV